METSRVTLFLICLLLPMPHYMQACILRLPQNLSRLYIRPQQHILPQQQSHSSGASSNYTLKDIIDIIDLAGGIAAFAMLIGFPLFLYFAKKAPSNIINDTPYAPTAQYVGNLPSIIEDIKYYITHPEERMSGSHLPRGIIFAGPPGTGKSLCAHQVAVELGCMMHRVTGSSFTGKYLGESTAWVRELFSNLHKLYAAHNTTCQEAQRRPVILILDEFEVLGMKRMEGGSNEAAANDHNSALNQLLAEIDGIHDDIFIIAITNRPEILDPALIRPERLFPIVYFNTPSPEAQRKIAQYYASKYPLADEANVDELLAHTSYTGAQLTALFNHASLHAARHQRSTLNTADLAYAKAFIDAN